MSYHPTSHPSSEPSGDRRPAGKDRLEFNKLHKRLRRQVGNAIADYQVIESGDRLMVCLSGGRDCYAMVDMLLGLQNTPGVAFSLVAVNMDQEAPGSPEQVLP